jgi:hypothetical protein
MSVGEKVKISGIIMSVGKISPEDTLDRLVITKKTLAGIATFSRQLVIIIYSELIIVHMFAIAPPTTSCKKKFKTVAHRLTDSNTSPAV